MAASSSLLGGCFDGKLVALEMGLGVSFKEKSEITRCITENGGKVAYMINKKVKPTTTSGLKIKEKLNSAIAYLNKPCTHTHTQRHPILS